MQNIMFLFLTTIFCSNFLNASSDISEVVKEVLNDNDTYHHKRKFLYKLTKKLGTVNKKFRLDRQIRFSHLEARQLYNAVQKASGEYTIYTGGDNKDPTDFVYIVPQSFFSPYTNHIQVINSDLHNFGISQSITLDSKKVYKFAEVSDSDADIIYNGAIKGIDDAEVAKNISKYGCKISVKNKKFEPNDEAKGKVARACAYILTTYQWLLPKMDELIDIETMLEWHEKHPVTEAEKKREEEIFKAQGNHNPYIRQEASYMREIWCQ